MINKKQAIYIIWASILNQSQDAESTVIKTKILMERLNLTNDFDNSYNILDFDLIHKAMTTSPIIHRFHNNMSAYLSDSVRRIRIEFKNNPAEVFNNISEGFTDIHERLVKFNGIGKHKAEIAAIITGAVLYGTDSVDFSSKCFNTCPKFNKTLEMQIDIINDLA